MLDIGRLTDIAPREAWRDEARDFTPWLCENLDHIGELIGLPLEFEEREASVDAYSADILARNPMDDTRVLIENQLERSDHRHLGQIMTYLAGLEAQVIVWVATGFTEPHLAAIKWLNEHTADPFAFFALRLRVVRIGTSVPAPVFEVLERPNRWERQLQTATRERRSRSKRGVERREFWELFSEVCPDTAAKGVTVNGSSSQWLVPGVASHVRLSIYLALGGVGVFLRGNRGVEVAETHRLFHPRSAEFSDLVGGLTHDSSEVDHPGAFLSLDMTDRANWDEACRWLGDRAERWLDAADRIFGPG